MKKGSGGFGSLALGGKTGSTTASLLASLMPSHFPNLVLISGHQWFCSHLFPISVHQWFPSSLAFQLALISGSLHRYYYALERFKGGAEGEEVSGGAVGTDDSAAAAGEFGGAAR